MGQTVGLLSSPLHAIALGGGGYYSQSLWPMDTDDTAASLASNPVPDEGTHE